MRMELRHLRYFVIVAEAENVTAVMKLSVRGAEAEKACILSV
jgi:hypothetical protein